MIRMIAQPTSSTLGRVRTLVMLLAFPLLILPIAGCDSKPQDVTNDPAFGNFSSVVGTWKTKVPMRLVEIQKKLYLLLGDRTHSGQELALFPAGTEIRIEQLIFRDTFETTYLDVIGSLVAAPHSGKKVNVDSGLFMPVALPLYEGATGTPTQYYEVWNRPKDAKPDWVAAPDKIVR